MDGATRTAGRLGMILLLAFGCRSASEARYVADFETGAPGWSLPRDERLTARVADGRLVMDLKAPQTVGWALAPFAFQEGEVAVEATLLEGSRSTDYGLIVLAQGSAFYRFAVSADGFYAVFAHQGDRWRVLVDWTPHGAVRTGRTTNHLRVRCEGAQMQFWINGVLATAVPREAFEG
ncbi:MAG: hypothetical protein C4314_02360, partial [Thermoflexus sp.]